MFQSKAVFFLHFKFDDFSMGYKSKPDKHSDLQKILAVWHLRETYEVKRKPSPLAMVFWSTLLSLWGAEFTENWKPLASRDERINNHGRKINVKQSKITMYVLINLSYSTGIIKHNIYMYTYHKTNRPHNHITLLIN